LFDRRDSHDLIHITMVPNGTLLQLSRLHPFPLPMFDTHHLMIDAREDVLAISLTETRYNVQLSSTDLLSCHRMNQVFMCDSFGVMSKRFNDTCLGALYMQLGLGPCDLPAGWRNCRDEPDPEEPQREASAPSRPD
jgi:hypothetical protein